MIHNICLVAQHEVATSVSILPWGGSNSAVQHVIYDSCLLIVQYEVATSASILPMGARSLEFTI